MPFKFNAISGKLDYFESTDLELITSSILTDYNESIEETVILFDNNGILYVNDCEEG